MLSLNKILILIMGKIIQHAILQNTADMSAVQAGYIDASQIRGLELDLLVDTSAAMLCLPSNIIEQLGLFKMHERAAITANGEVKVKVYSPVRLQIKDREANLDVMEVPLGTPALLGYLPLEALDLYPNLQNQCLEGNPKYDGKMVMDLL
jgi:predicted aspartyl protease